MRKKEGLDEEGRAGGGGEEDLGQKGRGARKLEGPRRITKQKK